MHNEVQWASYNEEEQELFCVPQTGQLGPMCVSNRKKKHCSSKLGGFFFLNQTFRHKCIVQRNITRAHPLYTIRCEDWQLAKLVKIDLR